MKNWIKRSIIGIFGASVLFGGLSACSHRMHHPGAALSEADVAKLRERFIGKASRELTLDEAQKAKLGMLADAIKAQRLALVTGGGNSRTELQALVAGTQFDRSKAQALVEAKTGALRERSPAVVSALGDFYERLKPEQQQKVRDIMARVRSEQLSHLAQAFYRPDEARTRTQGGVGLGLYLCQQVAQSHGGRLLIERAEPGLEVSLELPAPQGEERPSQR